MSERLTQYITKQNDKYVIQAIEDFSDGGLIPGAISKFTYNLDNIASETPVYEVMFDEDDEQVIEEDNLEYVLNSIDVQEKHGLLLSFTKDYISVGELINQFKSHQLQ